MSASTSPSPFDDFSAWLQKQSAASKIRLDTETAAKILLGAPAEGDGSEWARLGQNSPPELRQKVVDGLLVSLERWHRNHQPADPIARENVRQAGVNARKALSKLIQWGWSDDIKWRMDRPDGYGAPKVLAENNERALLNTWVERQGGFDSLWAKADNASKQSDLLDTGRVLVKAGWIEEASEWTPGFAQWAAANEKRSESTGDERFAKHAAQEKKSAWSALFYGRKRSEIESRGEKIKALGQEWKEAGLLPSDENIRAEWLSGWMDNKLGAAEWLVAIASAGFLPSDRSSSASYQPPLHQVFSVSHDAVPGLAEKLLEMGENPLEKNSQGISAWEMARSRRSLRTHAGPAFEALEKRVKAEQEREEMQAAVSAIHADKEAQLGRWALALLRQGAAFDAQGKKLTLDDLQTLGPLFLADQEASGASASLDEPAQAKPKSRSRL